MAQCCECHQSLATSSGFKAHLLPCLHLLCQRCLSDHSGYPYVHCPVCKKLWEPSDVGNYELGDASMRCQMEGCPEKAMAVVMCEECQEALCSGCLDAHQRVTVTRNHQLNQIPSASSLLCKNHPDKLVQSLCQCGDFVCVQCTLIEHTDHQQPVTLETLADGCKDELRVIDENVTKKLLELNVAEEEIRNGLHSSGDQAKKQVSDAVDHLKNKRANAVCDSINVAIREKQRDEPILGKLQQQRGVWQRAQSFAQAILQCANPVSARRSKNQLTECLNRVDQSMPKQAIDHHWQIPVDTSAIHLEDAIKSWARLLPADGTLTASEKNPSQTELESGNVPVETAVNGGDAMVSDAEFHQMKEAALASERKLSQSLAEIDRLKKKLKEKEVQVDSGVPTDSVEVPSVPTEQLSRAVNAARLLGVEGVLQRDYEEELRQKDAKYKRYKKLYLDEQKMSSKLQKKLKVKKVGPSTTEVVPYRFSGAHHQLRDTGGVATSPLDRAQQEGQKRRRLMMGQQLIVISEQPQVETIGDPSAVEEDGTMPVEALPATAIPAPTGSLPLVTRKRRQQLLPPPLAADAEENDVNSVAVAGLFKCAQCPRPIAFTSAQRLAEHTDRYHSARHQHFPCPDCGQQFSEKRALVSHQRLSHSQSSDAKPFECDQCHWRFKTAGNLKVHKRVHSDERPFVCAVCQAAFKHHGALKAHERGHSGETPFACPFCAKKFVSSSNCRSHQKYCTDRVAAE